MLDKEKKKAKLLQKKGEKKMETREIIKERRLELRLTMKMAHI